MLNFWPIFSLAILIKRILLKKKRCIVNENLFFSTFSELKSNKSKCEIAVLGALKGVKSAVCEMLCIDLMLDAIKALGNAKLCCR